MKRIEVCLSPELLPLYELEGRLVVVTDIFRATSCMVAALSHGVRHIVPVAKVDECLELRAEGYVLAGERNGMQVEGFDLGNSPFSYVDGEYEGKKVAMTTTNGTLALTAAAKGAEQVVAGAFLNLGRVVSTVKNWRGGDVLILCAGWKGKFSMEDTLFAGALLDQLAEDADAACDSAISARSLYQYNKSNLFEYLKSASHFRRLSRLGVEKDMQFCLEHSVYNVLPLYQDGRLIAG